VIELVGDLPALGHRILLTGQQQRARQQRLTQLREQRLHHPVVGDAHPDGALPGVHQPLGHL
jgi:hypothetical protein